ncbi:DUF488 family protein [Ligilactobacillus saerimneri]|uniref:DUF488 family protein n=1 Tax=Ligilactobacillus saerimneri TaxID=228229 RepID=A0A7H9ELZ4_9LACO|nr:DUF488 family protein [Ligilactobacillus saerimneri]QLL78730.1 DUF488 family protein [Ligilactobacillus saerimneri]
MQIRIARIYQQPADLTGYRVLVDRLWPRGISKEKAHLDQWLKEVAPSNELRKWFAHDPAKFADFKVRYQAELADNPAYQTLQDLAHQHELLILLYGAKDERHNQAVILQEKLQADVENTAN